MEIIEFISGYGAWSWIIGGVALLALELVAPGGVLVWLGGAAIVVGLITLVQPLSWPVQWVLYGVLSIVSLVSWLKFSRRAGAQRSDRPFLNQRAARFVGQETVLEQAIVDGFGRVNLEDSVWRVSGPDLPVGARVKITGFDAAILTVEAVNVS